ncbi:hypothetical protein A4R26_23805 [Niastella populi]|uniref:Ig-like domain-containing protein n=1 Tax=Niastella populi TaxID=550983 RepID=A0A1V9FGS6_9BACT|nr:hypothetical protein A4R26_23805 [Niastella populi]
MLFFFFLSNYLSASPDCPIVNARFPLANGTTSDPSATGWYLNSSNVASTGYFAVKSNRLHAQELGGEGIWYSRVFSNPGYSEFQVAVKVSSEGDMNSSEYVRIYYKINGGAEILLDQRTGNFGTIDFISPVLTGNNVQLVVRLYNYNNGGSQTSKYYIEEYRMFKEKGPCTVTSGITVTAAAANGGILTCASPSLGLSATATGSGTTTWSWTGPNGYTSTAQNPVITAAGTYTVVATNSTGTGSASVTVTENKTAPVITATGGGLACGSCVTISATSNVSGATYSWSGPNSFTSTSQNPTVCAAGTYTVTVTNPANGCSAQQSVTVSASAVTTFWLEDFTGLSNGTTSDAGTTAWTTSAPGSGTYSIQNSEYKASFSGGQGVGTWTSQVIDISSKTNVSFSVDLRSEVATSSDAFETGDYIRVYYKLNGGAETLAFEDLAGLGSTTNTTSSTTFNSSTFNGSTLQVIIKTSNSDPSERYFFDNIKLTGSNAGTTTITPAVTGIVTCTAAAQLSATATGTVTAWSWTGPNGFTSPVQNPAVNVGGQYIVTATFSSGCTASGTISVPENKTPPDIAATGGNLACLSVITLNVNSTVPNATYSWTGPNNFTSNSKNPTVSTAGTYVATVTNPANGCTTQQSVSVTSGTSSTPAIFWLEDFSGLSNGTTSRAGAVAWTATTSGSGTYSVQNNEFKTTFSGQAEGVWSSQEINIAGKTGVTFSVNLRSETASTNDAFENGDYIRVYYKLNGGAETLVFEDVAGLGTTTNGTASVTVTSAALNGSTLQVIIKTSNSDPTERYYFDNIKLEGSDITGESVTANGGVITCTSSSVTLSGNAASGGVSYSWTGPNNFTSTAQNPVVTASGIYTLTVHNPATGCSGIDTAIVVLNTTAPGATASASGSLSCSGGSSVTLSGSSSTSNVTYSWTGPNNFTATTQNPVVTVAGTYNLTVTNPANGCTSNTSAVVTFSNTITGTAWLEDFTLANGTSSDAGATPWTTAINPSTTLFSVLNNEFRISNSTTTGEGVWTSGAIDISGKTNISISTQVRSSIINDAVMNTTGEYADYIRFYYKLNNGTEVLFAEKLGTINNHSTTPTPVSISGLSGNSLQIVVRARATGNDEFYYFDNMQVVATSAANVTANATGGAINCINNSVTLQGSSAASGASYTWSGPNGYSSTVQNPVVNAPGSYTLTVTLGGCSATATATVTRDTTKPAVTASADPLQLTCIATSSTLAGSSTTPGVSYSWSNAGGVIASTPSTSVTIPGNYTLTVTNPANGCSSTSQVSVSQDTIAPTAVSATHNGTITCITPGITIEATVSSGNLNYSWSGPNGFSASTLSASITRGGTYVFTATSPTNGCTATASTIVEENTTPPGEISINNSGIINCLTSSVTISGSSSSSGVDYRWEGPNGYIASSALATVTHGGQYTLTATNPVNGCTSSKSTIVTENTAPPEITFSNSGPITCANPEVTLTVTSNSANASYLWLGDDFISDQPTTITGIPGLYIITVTDLVTGCSVTDFMEVAADYSDCGARKATPLATAKTNEPTVTGTNVTSFTYKAYPNPVITNGIIEFTSPQSANATVSIYNALGACEKVLFKGNVMANRLNRVAVPASQLAAGNYYYIINSGSRSFTGKLVIVK